EPVLVGAGTREEVALDVAEDHSLDAIEVVEAVVRRVAERLHERLPRVVAEHAAEVADARNGSSTRRALSELRHVAPESGKLGDELLLLGGDAHPSAAAAIWRRLGQRDT